MAYEIIPSSDLVPLFSLTEDIVLFVKQGDEENPMAPCLQIEFRKQLYFTELLGRFLKFGPYEFIPKEVRFYYENKIGQWLPDEVIVQMMRDFTEYYEKQAKPLTKGL